MMHDREFGARRAKRLKVRQVSPGELTAQQRVRIERDCRTLDEKLKMIRVHHLKNSMRKAGPDSPWFLLRVAMGRELVVEKQLRDLDIECLVVMRMGRERRARHRVIESQSEPALTGYVFVRFLIADDALSGIMAVEHAVGLLGEACQPLRIAHEKLMEYNELALAGGLDWEHVGYVVFKAGQGVMVTAGPFEGMHGSVVSCRSDGRGDAVVQLGMFGGVVPVTLPVAILSKV